MTGDSNPRKGEAMRTGARPVRKAGLFGSTALVPVAAALAGSLMLLAPSHAMAQDSGAGGAGGSGTGSNGGAGGANGGNGGDSVCIANVFPGCVVATGGVAGSGGSAGSRRGGNGGDGQFNDFGGGGGGAGGVGFRFTSVTTSTIATGAAGGNGGSGGTPRSIGAAGGGGGGGGHGLAYLGGSTITISGGTVSGGNGGDGGFGRGVASSGGGGEGGSGLFVIGTGPTSITIASGASVLGGNGGAAGLVQAAGTRGAQGAAGSGIRGADLSITTSGAISGGLLGALAVNGDPIVRGSAITFTGGTNNLTLGTGASFVGNIAVTGTLNLVQNTNATLGTAITGAGVINKTGTGTLSITGDNTNTGNTTIVSGALQFGNGGTSGAPGTGAITINSGASLRFNRSDTFTVATAIGGAGDFEMAGSGTLILTSNNSITGTAIISAGRLVFGDGGTSGVMVASAITNNAALEYNRSNNISADLIISGTGSVTQSGTGTLTLSGINSYAGGTFLNAGIVRMTNTNSLGANTGAITFNGGTLQFGNAFNLAATRAITINAGGGTIDTNGFVTTLSQAITGVGALTKTGGSNLLLSGASTYQGGTAIQQGSIFVAGTSALGTGTVTLATGTRLGAFNDGTISNAIVMNGPATFEANVGATLTLAGAISGGQAASFNGRVVLGGSNSFSTASISAGSTLIVGNGGTSGTLGLGAVTNSGALILERSDNFTVSNAITGTGTLRKLGAGTATLSGNLSLSSVQIDAGQLALTGTNTFTGGITVAGGTLSLGSNGAAGGAGGVIRTIGSVIDYADGINSATPIVLNSNTTQLQVLTGSATQSGVISEVEGSRPIEKIGAGNLTLTAANSYTGLTTVSAGTLTVTNSSALGTAAGGTIVNSGATLQFRASALVINEALTISGTGSAGIGALRVANTSGLANEATSLTGAVTLAANSRITVTDRILLTLAGPVQLGASTLTLNSEGSGNSNIRINGAVSGTGGLVKDGPGLLDLLGTNNFTGPLTINAGDVVLDFGSALADTTAVEMAAAGRLFLGASETIGSLAGAGTVVLTAGSILTTGGNNASTTLSGNILTNGGLTKVGTGTFTLSGTNSYTGLTTISAGTLQIGSGGTTGTLGSGNVVNNAALAFNRSNNFTVGNAISGSGTLTKLGAGTLTLTGANSYGGLTTITAGTLQIGNGGTTGTLGGSNILNNGVLAFNRSDDITLANAITGTGSLLKQGGGVTTLTGLTQASAVRVEAGTLILSRQTFSPIAVTVAGGNLVYTLPAAGGLGGTTVQDGGSLILRASTSANFTAGTLTLSGTGFGGTGALRNQTPLTATSASAVWDGIVLAGDTLVSAETGVLFLQNISGAGRTLTVAGDAATLIFGMATGTGGLVKTGAGTLTLLGANNYSGATTINGGTVEIRNNGSLGTGALNINNATLAIGPSVTYTFNGGSFATARVTGSATQAGLGIFRVATPVTASGGDGFVNGTTGLLGLSLGGGVQFTLFGTNTFTGGISVEGATSSLRLAAPSAAGGANGTGNTITLSGAVLSLGAGTYGNNIVLASAGSRLDVTGADVVTLPGVISQSGGTFGFEKTGSGTLILSGTNTYAGGTTISAGRLQVASDANLGAATGGITIGNGVLATTAAFSSARAISLTGAAGIDVSSSPGLTLSGILSGTGSLTKSGTGGLILTGNNSYAGTTTINGSGGLFVGFGGTSGSLGTGNVVVNTGSFLAFNRTDAVTVANAISGSGVVVASGTGTLTLTGANSFTGNLSVAGGTVVLGSAAAGVINAAGTGTIQMVAGTRLRSVVSGTLSNALTINAANLTLAAATGTTLRLAPGTLQPGGPLGSILTFGSATDTGTIELAPQALILGEATQGIVVNGGTLRLANDNAFNFANAGSGITLNGATLGSDLTGSLTRVLTVGAAGGTVDVAPGTLTLQTDLSGPGLLTKTGAGELRLAGAVSANGGLRLNAGSLGIVTGNSGGWGSGGLEMATGTSLSIDLPLPVTYANNILLGAGAGSTILSRNTVLSGVLSGGTLNVGALTGSNFLVLAGNNTYGATNIAAGARVQVGLGGTSGMLGTGAVTLGTGSVLSFVRSDGVTVSNVFSGSGAIQKQLGNTINLTGINTATDRFTGSATVFAGTLLVNGVFGDPTGRAAIVRVLSGATLGGAGTIAGNVFVNSGGVLAPGNSPGTLSIAGNLNLADTSVINFELGQAGTVGGANNDLISVGGNLVLDGILNVAALPGFGSGYYRLFNYGGTLTNNLLTLGTLPTGFDVSLRTDIAGQVNVLFNNGAQQIQYWDGTDLTGALATVNGEGGSGTWTSTSTNWTTPTGFSVNSNWAGQVGVFAGAAGTVSITGAQAFQELRFLTNGYTLNASAPGAGSLATTGGFSIIDVASGIGATIAAPITGTGGLTKTGAGTLTLAGPNTFTGLTTIAGGTLVNSGTIASAVQNNATLTNSGTITGLVTNAASLTSTGTLSGGLVNNALASASIGGTVSGPISNSGTITLTGATSATGAMTQIAGGVFNLVGNSASLGSLAGSGTITLGTGSLSVGSNGVATIFAGTISGSGALRKTGAGFFTLTGNNSYGATFIDAGSLQVGAGGTSGTLGTGAVTNNAQLFFNRTDTITVANAISGSGQVVNAAGGTVMLSGANTYTGGTNVAAGRVIAASNSALGASSGGVTIAAGASLGLQGGITIGNALTIAGEGPGNAGALRSISGNNTVSGRIGWGGQTRINSDAGLLTLTGSLVGDTTSPLTVGGAGDTRINGAISGNTSLVKDGTGILTLAGANVYTGSTTVASGTLQIVAGGSLTSGVTNNGSLINVGTISGGFLNNGLLGSTGTLGRGLVNSTSGTAFVSGQINGDVINQGSLTLTGNTTGIVNLSQNPGNFDLGGFNTTIASLAGAGGAVALGSATLTLSGTGLLSTTYDGMITGTGSLIKNGPSTFSLSRAQTYTGLTTINGGTLIIGAAGSLAGAVQNNANFTSNGTIAGLVTNAGALSSTGTLAGGLSNGAGASANIRGVVSGTLTNAGTVSLTGTTTGISTLSQAATGVTSLFGANTSVGSLIGSGTVNLGGATLTVGATNVSGLYSGTIAGSGGLTKVGTGTLTLAGSNTAASNFTGTANVNAGTLVINGSFGDAVARAATLNLASGATLGGSGTFLGSVSVAAGGILAPGNSPGTLAIGGNLVLNTGSILNFELAQAGVVGGGINDLITVAGNLTLAGTLNVTALPGFGPGIYRLFNYGGTLTNNGLTFGTMPADFLQNLITDVAGEVSIQFRAPVVITPDVLYWDGIETGTGPIVINGLGGPGVWNATNTNWTAAPDFAFNYAWGGNTAVFAGASGGVVQVSGTQGFQQLRFETGGYTLTTATGGGGLATTGGTSIITVATGLGARIDTVIGGSGGLSKGGAGTLTLGGANTFTVVTAIGEGTLAIAAGGALASGILNSATFTNAGTVSGLVQTFLGATTTNTGTFGGGATNAGTLISSGTISGDLTNSGTATLSSRINGAIANSGTITLAGTLRVSGTLTQTTSGIFDLAGRGAVLGGLAGAGQVRLGAGTLTVGDGTSTSFAGVISGTGNLTKVGTGTLTLTGANSFTGLTSVDGGGLTLAAGGALAGGVGNAATFTNAGTVAGLVQTFVGATTTNTGTFGGSATNAGTLTSTGIINGDLSNTGRAVLAGRINGAFVNAATASLSGALTVTGAFTQNAGGTFSLGNFAATIGSLAGAGAVQLQTGSLTVGSNNASTVFSGVISGTGSLTKLGTGTLTLTGANTYTGLTVIDGGTLVIGAAAGGAAPAAASTTVSSGGGSAIAAAETPAFAAERVSLPGTAIFASGTSEPDSPLSAAPAIAGLGQTDTAPVGDVLPSGERLALIGRSIGGPAVVDALAPGALAPASAAGEFLVPTGAPEPHSDLGPTGDLGNAAAFVQFDRAIAASDEAPSGEPVSAPAFAAVADAGGSTVVTAVAPTAFAETTPPSTAVIAGSILNNATLINNGTVLGGLLNSAGANATNAGVIRGAVTNRGTLTSTGTLGGGLDNGGTARISGIVTGAVINSGSITLTGTTSGITVLEQAATGVFDLAGLDTTIGSLSGAGSVLLGGARLTTGSGGVNTLFSGVISGNGALTKVGTGALILTGTNTYAGGTTIAGGILQIGNGGTSGSIVGPVVNNGAFVINRSDSVTFDGPISGSGLFVQAGTGTTTLTGANTYRGGTLISGGRLIGNTASLQGLIQNDAALEFAQNANGVFAGGIFGTGLFDKTGAGLLELTGDASGLRGATTVRAGELRVTGSLASSVTTVLSGASLSGNGVIGGLVARSGATIAPGANGLGVLGVNGAVQIQSGSTLQLQVQALQGADAILSNGAMQIGGTAAFSNLGGVFAFNSRYVLLQTSGTRTGTFDVVTGFADFGILYRPELVYTANQVVLRMAPNLLTNIVGTAPLTPNQRAIVTVIDTAVTAGYNPQPLFNIYALPNAQLPGAFDQLTGEVYATSAGVGIEQERLVREAVLGRTAEVALASRKAPEMGTGAGAWGQIFAGWGQGDRSANTARFENDRTGFINGVDYGRANDEGSWRIGAYGFFMRNRVTLNARGSRGEIEQAGGGIYAGFNRGGFSAAIGGSLAEVDFDATRTILLPGFAEVNRGRTNGRAVQGFGELSYGVTGGKFVYRTFVNVALGSFKLDGLNETGGAAALTVARQDYNTGSVTAGVDGSLQTGRLRLSGMLAGRAQIGDRDPTARVALLAAPGDRLAINGAQLDDVALSARFDASVAVSKSADIAVGYTGLIGSKTTDHAVRATFSLRF